MKPFQCKMCGECCNGKGGINVDADEIEKISKFLDISRDSFVSEFCMKKKDIFSIKIGPDGSCIFFDQTKSCLIHPVKPRICSRWPFYPANINDKDTWEMAREACPGINPDCAFEEFVAQAKKE